MRILKERVDYTMRKLFAFTATRAEYGLLKPIIKKLNCIEEFDLRCSYGCIFHLNLIDLQRNRE